MSYYQLKQGLKLLQALFVGIIFLIGMAAQPAFSQLLPPTSSSAQNTLPTQQPLSQQQAPQQQLAQQDPKAALLAQLDAYIEPDPISMWPLALGWWLLIAFLLIAPTVIIIMIQKNRTKQRYFKIALRQLDKINAQHGDTPQKQQAKLAALTVLTKQVYKHVYPQHKTALALTGKTWWCLLYQLAPMQKIALSDLEKIPFDALYSPNMTLSISDFNQLSGFARHWIQHPALRQNNKDDLITNAIQSTLKKRSQGVNHV